jgi:hypothetical protein
MSKKRDLELLKLISDYTEHCYNISYELYRKYYYEEVWEDISLLVLGFKAIRKIVNEIKKVIEKYEEKEQ